MDIIDILSATEIRARIFLSKSRLRDLKDKRKRHYKEINGAKKLIRFIESSIDKGNINDVLNLETDSVRIYLSFLRESLIDLEHLWSVESEFCRILHRKIDQLGERVYL